MSTAVSFNPLNAPKLDTISLPGHDEAAPARSNSGQSERPFDSASERDWCELIRDIVAIANSGGGQVVLRHSAQQPPADATPVSQTPVGASDIIQRLAKFTDSAFADIHLRAAEQTEPRTAVLMIGGAPFPIVFTKPGKYVAADDPAGQIEVFAAGSVYFWDGEKSEPASSRSLQVFLERAVRRVRRRWLSGIRRVVKQPVASIIGTKQGRTGKQGRTTGQANLRPVRIVTDPNAPALQPQDVDRLYPLRQKDLVAELNRRLGRRALNSYDIQAVRRQHRLDERPDFVFHLPGAGRRYSPAVMEWIIDQFEHDPDFFRKARAADNEMLRLRRQKPR